MAGEGKYFPNRQAAEAAAHASRAGGNRNIDVGCFQLNYRWHGDKFPSLSAMFNPLENALHAAEFVGELFEESGSWIEAAGAYHSRTPHFANRYKERFQTILARINDAPIPEYGGYEEPLQRTRSTGLPTGQPLIDFRMRTAPASPLGSTASVVAPGPSILNAPPPGALIQFGG
jgi:hypothetical protein